MPNDPSEAELTKTRQMIASTCEMFAGEPEMLKAALVPFLQAAVGSSGTGGMVTQGSLLIAGDRGVVDNDAGANIISHDNYFAKQDC
jgi:hypothetical protein